VTRMGNRRGAYRILVDITEGKRPFGRTRRRWEDNINIHFKKCDGEPWIGAIRLRIGRRCGLW